MKNEFSNALEKCTKLLNTERYKRTIGDVEQEAANEAATRQKKKIKKEEEEEQKKLYKLILDCNALTVDIDATIVFIHN